uniref:Uncharacterized protein n=1 Tax=Aotus nancymaae TaxID=37293 RepID=A0A2K5CW10_AOTNA
VLSLYLFCKSNVVI